MTYNFEINEGIYPGEPGYKEWTGFESSDENSRNYNLKTANPIPPFKIPFEKLLKKD